MIKIAEIWNTDFVKVAKELEQNVNQVNHIILDFLCEVSYKIDNPGYYEIFNIAYKHNIPVTIATPYLRDMPPLLDFNDVKYKNIKMIHWETFWFNRTYQAWKPYNNLNKEKNLEMYELRNGEHLEFKYPYITLNNISKNHRCLVMDLLAKHNLINVGAIAWRDIRRECDNIRHTFPDDVTDSVYYGYPYKYWKPKRMILDQNVNDLFLQETLPIEFSQSFMQLVTESDNETVFFSEKTATPILLNKLFLVAGAKGNHAALKNQGFQLYDEIFDYSFDELSTDADRYEGLIENIKRISSFGEAEMKKIHNKIFEKLVYNKQHALNLINTIPNEILSIVELIRKENKDPYNGPLNMFYDI